MNLKTALHEYLKEFKTATRDELRQFGRKLVTSSNPNGYDLAGVDRELRRLTEEVKIVPYYNGKYIAGYKLDTEPFNKNYNPDIKGAIIIKNEIIQDRLFEPKKKQHWKY